MTAIGFSDADAPDDDQNIRFVPAAPVSPLSETIEQRVLLDTGAFFS